MSIYEGVGFSNSANIPDDLFILDPSHQKMVTGKRNYRYIWSKFGIAGLFIAFFIGLMFAIALPEFMTEFRLATSKTGQAKAQVTDHRVSRGSKSTSYYITYAFMGNERSYTHEAQATSSEYNNYEIGSTIPVTFVLSDPTVSHIGENGIRWTQITPILIMVGVFLLIGIIWQITLMPKYFRMRRMRRNGQIILGQLKGTYGEMIKRGSGKNRRTDYDVTAYYQFTNPNGRKIDSQATFTRNDYKKKDLPQSGSVAVLYVSGEDYLLL